MSVLLDPDSGTGTDTADASMGSPDDALDTDAFSSLTGRHHDYTVAQSGNPSRSHPNRRGSLLLDR